MGENELVDRAAHACMAAVRRLREAGIVPEALAEYVPASKRLLVLNRAASMRPLGDVWHLGALLLDTDGRLYIAGRATRSAERGRVGYQSVSLEERRAIAAAALHGGYPVGTPVNFDARPVPTDIAGWRELGPELPLGIGDGEIRVRWRAGAPLEGAPTLERFLDERVGLLINPLSST